MKAKIIIVFFTLLLFSCSTKEEPLNPPANLFLLESITVNTDSLQSWLDARRKLVDGFIKFKHPNAQLVYKSNDSLFFLLSQLTNYNIINKGSENSYEDSELNTLLLNQLKFLKHSKSGIISYVPEISICEFQEMKGDNYALFEFSYIKPGKTKFIEENWIRWQDLHKRINSGIKYSGYKGHVGFDSPFYLALIFSKDSTTMHSIFKKMWDEAGDEAKKLQEMEANHYKLYLPYYTNLQPDLSYWPN